MLKVLLSPIDFLIGKLSHKNRMRFLAFLIYISIGALIILAVGLVIATGLFIDWAVPDWFVQVLTGTL